MERSCFCPPPLNRVSIKHWQCHTLFFLRLPIAEASPELGTTGIYWSNIWKLLLIVLRTFNIYVAGYWFLLPCIERYWNRSLDPCFIVFYLKQHGTYLACYCVTSFSHKLTGKKKGLYNTGITIYSNNCYILYLIQVLLKNAHF